MNEEFAIRLMVVTMFAVGAIFLNKKGMTYLRKSEYKREKIGIALLMILVDIRVISVLLSEICK